MYDLLAQAEELTERERSLIKLASPFVSIAMDLFESGEAEDVLGVDESASPTFDNQIASNTPAAACLQIASTVRS